MSSAASSQTKEYLNPNLVLYSLSRTTSYRQISWSLQTTRLFDNVIMIVSPWNFRAIGKVLIWNSWLRDFTRFCGKTSTRLVNSVYPRTYAHCLRFSLFGCRLVTVISSITFITDARITVSVFDTIRLMLVRFDGWVMAEWLRRSTHQWVAKMHLRLCDPRFGNGIKHTKHFAHNSNLPYCQGTGLCPHASSIQK